MINAEDFTYSKGYLGLLSALGASLGIIFCCVPSSRVVYRELRDWYRKRRLSGIHTAQTDEEANTITLETSSLASCPIIDDTKTLDRDKSAQWSLDRSVAGVKPRPYGRVKRTRTF